MFWNLLKVAIRNLKKHKVYSLINIAGLTVGMACFIFISLWIYDETHYDTFHAQVDRLFRLTLHKASDPADTGIPNAPYMLPKILKDEFPEIEETVRVRNHAYPSAVRNGDTSFYEDGFFMADASFFTMFSYKFIEGDPATALAGTRAVVLTREAAAKYFGATDPLGKVLRWNETEDLVVTGVVEHPPSRSHLQFDLVGSIDLCGREKLSTWSSETEVYILLRRGASRDDVEAKISGIIHKYQPENDYLVSMEDLPDANLNLALGGGNDKRIILIFAVIAVAILVIACVNYTNISTARSSIRALEVGVRKTIGARRPEIIRQYLGEAIGLSFISLLFAVAIVNFIIPLYNKAQGKDMAILESGSLPVLLFLLAVALVTGLVAGSYPAFVLSSFKPAKILKKDLMKGRRSSVLRTVLVISQFAAAVVMIVLTVFARRQFDYIHKADLGFDRQRIVHFLVNDALRAKYDLFKERLLRNPGVLNVTAASALPHLLFNTNYLTWEGMTSGHEIEVGYLYVDPDYAKTFGLKIVQGRDFSKDISTDSKKAFLVNEAALSLLEDKNPLGKRLTLGRMEGRIIGVVKNFNFRPLIFKISPLVIAVRPDRYYDLLVKIRPDDVPGTLAAAKNVFAELTPGYPFKYEFVDDIFNLTYKPLEFVNGILNAFTGIALFISCLGLFGLASLLTEQRRKEVGIRKVLGASASGILALLSRRFFLTVLAANLIAVPVSYLVIRIFLNLFVYRIPFDLFVLIIAALATFAVALATISYQVWKTARINPSECLRHE